MESSGVPAALRERLDSEGTAGLLELLETIRRAWSLEVTTTCLERFERRLVEEVAGLRVEMAEGHATLRSEIAQSEGRLVKEMQIGLGTIRQEMANNRVEFLRWAFLFWVGQFFAVAGLVRVLMKTALVR
jgi:hypothetical protein